MKAVAHNVVHQYQPTPTTCSPTALAILLSHYNESMTPQAIEAAVPQSRDEKGVAIGTVNQQLATWCIQKGYDVIVYTADCQVIDQSWAELDREKQLERMELRIDGYVVPSLGAVWTRGYTEAYIDFVKSGGELKILPVVTTSLLYDLLENGPVLPCVSYSTMYGTKRVVLTENSEKNDDIFGRAANHSIVIYGYDEDGNFLVADPQRKPGFLVIEPERMIVAIATAQLECDNLLFQIHKR